MKFSPIEWPASVFVDNILPAPDNKILPPLAADLSLQHFTRLTSVLLQYLLDVLCEWGTREQIYMRRQIRKLYRFTKYLL